MRRPLLLLDAYLEDDPRPSWSPLVERAGRDVEWVRVADGAAPSWPLRSYAAVIQTGSAACLPDGVPWAPAVLPLLREVVDRSIPYLGVCWGHQALAEALGGPGTVVKRPLPEVGVRPVRRAAQPDPVLDALPAVFDVMISHEDEIGALPAGLVALAASEGCATQAVRVVDRPAWGVQFHPEMGRSEAAGLLARRARRHPELGLVLEDELARYDAAPRVGPALFDAFFREVGRREAAGPGGPGST